LKRRVLTVVLAALLAVLGVAAVLAYVRQANNRAVANLKAEFVLQATADIPAHTTLGYARDHGWVRTAKFPVGTLPPDPLRAVNAGNQTKVLGAAVPQGSVVVQSMLTTAAAIAASGGFVIPPGMVAVTIQVCLSESVAGYVTAGSKVAVFDTWPSKNAPQSVQQTCDVGHQAQLPGSANTRIVLKSVQVLAVGPAPTSAQGTSGLASTVTNGAAAGAQSNPPVLVTVAVNQSDAETVILVGEVGVPYLALLGNSSKTAVDAVPVQLFR
jgi:pilus assembly protein CpaB